MLFSRKSKTLSLEFFKGTITVKQLSFHLLACTSKTPQAILKTLHTSWFTLLNYVPYIYFIYLFMTKHEVH